KVIAREGKGPAPRPERDDAAFLASLKVGCRPRWRRPVSLLETNMTESFAELFEQSQQSLSKLRSGAIVTGTVVEIRSDVVVVNAGLKSEGIIPIEQFKNE